MPYIKVSYPKIGLQKKKKIWQKPYKLNSALIGIKIKGKGKIKNVNFSFSMRIFNSKKNFIYYHIFTFIFNTLKFVGFSFYLNILWNRIILILIYIKNQWYTIKFFF